jgi:hypothetical protein
MHQKYRNNLFGLVHEEAQHAFFFEPGANFAPIYLLNRQEFLVN